MNRKNKLILATIIILGFALRVFLVEQLPSILNRDEAALAYNGYLLAKTGLDEWQQQTPLALLSFGDYKLPGYPYLLAALFKFLPSNDFVVRLPSVIAGTVLIYLAYLWAKRFELNRVYQLMFSLLICLTPVYIFYSRMAWEANLALSLNLGAMLLLFRFKQTKKNLSWLNWKDILAVFLMLVAVFTYNSPLIYLPFIWPGVILTRNVKKLNSWLTPALGLGLVLAAAATVLFSLSSQKSGITVFTDETVWANYAQYRQQFPNNLKTLLGNQYLYWFGLMLGNIFRSFSFKFLVTQGGGHPWHNIPMQAHLFWSVYILGLIGIVASLYQLVFQLVAKNQLLGRKMFLLAALFISLLPAAITVDAPHATRSLLFFFVFSFFSILGLRFVLRKAARLIKNCNDGRFNQIALRVFAVLIGLEAGLYLHRYFYLFPHEQDGFKPGYDVIVQELKKEHPNKQVAVIDAGYHYILTAWYFKMDPQKYFETNIRQQPDKIGLRYGQQVGNFHFIADKNDRTHEEKILVYWDDDNDYWQVKKYP